MIGKTKNNKKDFRVVFTYLILFFFIWSIYEVGLAPYLTERLSENIFGLTNFFIKFMVWIIPVIMYLTFVEQVNIFSYLKLNENIKKGIIGALIVSFIFLVYNFLEVKLMGNLQIDLSLSLSSWLNMVIMAGLAEEIVFRGFLFRKFGDKIGIRTAMIISSLLFLFIHYPIWYVRGILNFPGLFFSSLYVFIIGMIMAYLYKKTDSLWSCIISHSLHNLIVTILVLV